MEIHLVPVLLGEGRRLFDDLGPEHFELELVRALEAPGVMHPAIPRRRRRLMAANGPTRFDRRWGLEHRSRASCSDQGGRKWMQRQIASARSSWCWSRR